MNVYVDSSVLLRLVLKEPGAIESPDTLGNVGTSSLTLVECMRVVDRVRLHQQLSDEELSRRRAEAIAFYSGCSVLRLDDHVLAQAAHPLPVTLGALDAIHLASAFLWRLQADDPVKLATHDRRLARAARSLGFEVVGA